MTEWKEFAEIDPANLFASMKLPVVIDGRNIFDAKKMMDSGFRYFPIGKGGVNNTI
jgi:UDPglucose 6-dehydrogenase